MKLKKRILSLLIASILVLALVPSFIVSAAGSWKAITGTGGTVFPTMSDGAIKYMRIKNNGTGMYFSNDFFKGINFSSTPYEQAHIHYNATKGSYSFALNQAWLCIDNGQLKSTSSVYKESNYWILELVEPYTYMIKNASTGQYLGNIGNVYALAPSKPTSNNYKWTFYRYS